MRAARLQVEDQGERLVDSLQFLNGEEADWLSEPIQVNSRELVAYDQGLLVDDGDWGRKLVSRAVVLVNATIQVLTLSQSGCRTTANRRPPCSWPLPRAGSR